LLSPTQIPINKLYLPSLKFESRITAVDLGKLDSKRLSKTSDNKSPGDLRLFSVVVDSAGFS
jgi:hypothetical protein